MLTLPIKKKWFDMVAAGKKPEEYRENNDYYRARIPLADGIILRLRNGYSASSPTLEVICDTDLGTGYTEWGAEPGKEYIILKIRECKRVEPEVFTIKATRCKRCGGILTSADAVRDGYGHTCKMKIEALKPNPNQIALEGINDAQKV